MKDQRRCLQCDKEFMVTNKNHNFCCRLCYRRYPNNKIKYLSRVRDYQKEHGATIGRRYGNLKHTAKHRDLVLSISLDEYKILVIKLCTYCGCSLELERGSALDRIDNSKGYTIDNVLPCCGKCNQIRNIHLTSEEMKIAMNAVLLYRKNIVKN